MQNRRAMQGQPKILKERKISQSNVILEESPKKFENIQLQKTKTNIIQAQQLSISSKSQSLKCQPWKKHPMQILFLKINLSPEKRTLICGTCAFFFK